MRGESLLAAVSSLADFRGAGRLTIEQISRVETLYNVKLDAQLMEEIGENHPRLLKAPK